MLLRVTLLVVCLSLLLILGGKSLLSHAMMWVIMSLGEASDLSKYFWNELLLEVRSVSSTLRSSLEVILRLPKVVSGDTEWLLNWMIVLCE